MADVEFVNLTDDDEEADEASVLMALAGGATGRDVDDDDGVPAGHQDFGRRYYHQQQFTQQQQQQQQPQGEQQDISEADGAEVTTRSSQHNETLVDDSVMCTICFEAWTSDGPHRIIALKCGHPFGLSCIEKWMITTKKCPTCQSVVRKADIRYLYVRSLRAMDTSERTSLLKTIEEKDRQIQTLKIAVANAHMESKLSADEVTKVREQCERLKSQLLSKDKQLMQSMIHGNSSSSSRPLAPISNTMSSSMSLSSSGGTRGPPGSSSRPYDCQQMRAEVNQFRESVIRNRGPATANFLLKHSESVTNGCAGAGCRVMASMRNMSTIAISLKNPNSLFPGFGVKKINTSDYNLSPFIPIHRESITDMVFKENDPLILTASMDKTVKLTSMCDNSTSLTLKLESHARSCCWNPNNDNNCFIGLSTGNVLSYDIRMASCPTHEFDGFVNNPLVSIQFVQKSGHNGNSAASDIPSQSRDDSFSGLLCNSLTKSYFFEIAAESSGDLRSKVALPFEGKFLPTHYDQESGFGLISTRPSDKFNQPTVLHNLINLTKDMGTGVVCVDVVKQFAGGNRSDILTKSKVFLNSESFHSNPLVFAADEANNAIMLFDVDMGGTGVKQLIKNPRQGKPVLDVALVSSDEGVMEIAALTETGISFYQRKSFL